jgi:hypothetical protein
MRIAKKLVILHTTRTGSVECLALHHLKISGLQLTHVNQLGGIAVLNVQADTGSLKR